MAKPRLLKESPRSLVFILSAVLIALGAWL